MRAVSSGSPIDKKQPCRLTAKPTMKPAGRPRQLDSGLGNDPYRRVSPIAPRSCDRLLSEPTAGTQPCGGTALHAPYLSFAMLVGIGSVGVNCCRRTVICIA